MSDTVKEKFALEVVRTVQTISKAGELVLEYDSCGYATISDENVSRLGITAAELVGCINLLRLIATGLAKVENVATVNKVKRAG